MVQLVPDIIARVTLYPSDRGGRKGPILPGRFGCPFVFQGEAFDCRLLLEQTNTTLHPGATEVVQIKFLCPDFVKPRLTCGATFMLWSAGNFADGEVLSIVN